MKIARSKILVIDDNEDLREFLAEDGYHVAADALAGMQALERGGIACVLCDIEGIQRGGMSHKDVLAACLAQGIRFACISGNYELAGELAQKFGIETPGKAGVKDFLESITLDQGASA